MLKEVVCIISWRPVAFISPSRHPSFTLTGPFSLDVVRPRAISTASDIFVLAGRMRLTRTELRPSEGKISAQGGPRSLVSTNIRGLGIVLSFKSSRSDLPDPHGVLILSTTCDKLRCGIIPRNDEFVPEISDVVFDTTVDPTSGKKELFVAYSANHYPLVISNNGMSVISALLEGIGVIEKAQNLLTDRDKQERFGPAKERICCQASATCGPC